MFTNTNILENKSTRTLLKNVSKNSHSVSLHKPNKRTVTGELMKILGREAAHSSRRTSDRISLEITSRHYTLNFEKYEKETQLGERLGSDQPTTRLPPPGDAQKLMTKRETDNEQWRAAAAAHRGERRRGAFPLR